MSLSLVTSGHCRGIEGTDSSDGKLADKIPKPIQTRSKTSTAGKSGKKNKDFPAT